jgi:hypothetical protein
MGVASISARRVSEAAVIGLVVVASLCGSILLIARFAIRGVWWLDFGVFRDAAQLPVAEIYLAAPPVPPFIYPPPSLMIFQLLGHFPLYLDLAVWLAVSSGLFAFAARSAGPKVLALVAISAPFVKSVLIGQISILAGGAILLATSKRGWALGATLGLVAAVKPHMVLMAPLVLLLRRDMAAFVAMGLAGLAACLLSVPLFGLDRWSEWINALPAFQQILIDGKLLKYLVSPAGVAQYWGLPQLPFLLAGIALGLAAVAGAARRAHGIELAALIVTASLLASPYALATDAIPILPFLACTAIRDRLSARTAAAFLILSMLHVAAGLILLGALWAAELKRQSAPRPTPAAA